MTEAPKKVVRVLDLACGTGTARFPTGRRYYGRAAIDYVGVDSVPPYTSLSGKSPREDLRETFFPEKLCFDDPSKLSKQLKKFSKGGPFDEIHLHMPAIPSSSIFWPASKNLKVIARFLKPGGRLYHLADAGHSPLIDLDADLESRLENPAELEDIVKSNKRKVAESAAKAGLVLDKYGFRPWPEGEGRPKDEWHTGGPTMKQTPSAQKAQRVLFWKSEPYSDFSDYAVHLMVFRKPRRAS